MAVRFVVRSRDGQTLLEELAFPFDQARIVLGRAPSADVRIPSRTVSEAHASVQMRGSDWLLTDLGSRNGTKHNGQRVPPERTKKLHDGDLLELGNYVLSFHTGVVMTEPMSAERTAELARRLWREAQSARGVKLDAPSLRVVNGPRAGTRMEIPPAPSRLHIGSHEGCQMQLPEAVLARETLEVVHDVEGVLIRSVSGDSLIQLSGHRYKARRLRDRDELQVGTTRLVFEEPAQVEIDSLKGTPDQPVSVKPTAERPEKKIEKKEKSSSGPATEPQRIERTQTAQAGRNSETPRPEPAVSTTPRTGPTIAELVIYALAIAVLLASGLALALLLRAR
ncbi:MAG TPA: FHA domain-containing protein [Polyangiales bacterium]|nr:FHA domain-containing protein [Polyangiales bacterium]